MDTRTRELCRELFKHMKILPMYSQHIYSLILYTVNNKHLYNTNNEIHKYRTRYSNNLHLPIVSLSKFKKGAYFSGIKVFSHLLECIKNLTNSQKCFITTLKRFNMCTHPADLNYGVNGGNMYVQCCKMKDHLELLINELKSSQLIIKILQEELHLTCTGLKKHDNLTNDESHSNSGRCFDIAGLQL